MNFEKFKGLIHESWWNKLRPFIESKECDNIYLFLKKQSERGKRIAPLSSNTFRAFKETSYDDVKVVIIGMAPYHSFKDGVPIADGLALSCSITSRLQPSLEQFYAGISNELRETRFVKTADLSYLAHQGVLLLNVALTVEAGKPTSHISLWKPFTVFLLTEVLDVVGAPVIFLGKDAAMYKKYLMPLTWSYVLDHPAYAEYSNLPWETEGVFTEVNKILKYRNRI